MFASQRVVHEASGNWYVGSDGLIVTKLSSAAGVGLIVAPLLTIALQALAHDTARAPGTVTMTIPGTASWYGPRFHGRTTASGEPFDMRDLTAAHRTLPFGNLVRSTNETNGRSVVVRINDRGPFHGKWVIDLSRKAARAIGLMRRGVGRVTLEVLNRH